MTMRVLPAAGAATLVAAVSVLLAPAAFANNAPGDNGTIKIHDAKTGEELVRNEPHVCTFYLDAFFFDGLQKADWRIIEIPPTGSKDELASSGAIVLDGKGHGRTAAMTLPDGHYKLVWNFDGEHGKAKHKVFWTDCTPASPTGTPSTSPSGSTSATPTTTSTAPAGGQPSASSSASTAPAPSGSASPSTGPGSSTGSLASTGASVLGITALAGALLAVGAVVRFRRRGGSPRH